MLGMTTTNLSVEDLETAVISDYVPGVTSLRSLARKYGVTHSRISRIIKRNNCVTLSKEENAYFVVANNLRFDVSHKYLMKYDDLGKLKILNIMITSRGDRYNVTTCFYIAYLERFYHCERFNKIYQLWIDNGKCSMRRPSIDHIDSISLGGEPNDLDNLRVVTWFENRAKNNLEHDKWLEIRDNIHEYLI